MKIFSIPQQGRMVKLPLKHISLVTAGLLVTQSANLYNYQEQREHQRNNVEMILSSQMWNDTTQVPSPIIEIAGSKCIAKFVIDVNINQLFSYDDFGYIKNVYPVASGSKDSPTHTGIRKVINVESYPYKGAPKNSKRYQNPKDYGPRTVILAIVDPNTGEISGYNGEFLHGTKNPSSIGKHVSKGCIRMHNETILALSKELKNGDLVKIIN